MSPDNAANMTVTVHNEDSGDVATLEAGRGTPVRTLLQRAYNEFNVEPRPGDRIRCDNGVDLTPHMDAHLGDLAANVCESLVWLFSGDQGGA